MSRAHRYVEPQFGPAPIDMRGKRLAHWVVQQQTRSRRSRAQWVCRCDCGETTTISGTHLRSMERRGVIACTACGRGAGSPNPANKA